jgi:hypothetical protein
MAMKTRVRRKSTSAIKAARTRLINRQALLWGLDRIAKTQEALEWSARRRAELQVLIDAADRSLAKVRAHP